MGLKMNSVERFSHSYTSRIFYTILKVANADVIWCCVDAFRHGRPGTMLFHSIPAGPSEVYYPETRPVAGEKLIR